MTPRLHRCQPHRIEYGDALVRCADCGRTWLRGPYRWRLINAGTTTPGLAERRKAAIVD